MSYNMAKNKESRAAYATDVFINLVSKLEMAAL